MSRRLHSVMQKERDERSANYAIDNNDMKRIVLYFLLFTLTGCVFNPFYDEKEDLMVRVDELESENEKLGWRIEELESENEELKSERDELEEEKDRLSEIIDNAVWEFEAGHYRSGLDYLYEKD